MSGPKCSSYEDVAARLARERVAALERFEAVKKRADDFVRESAVHAARHGIVAPTLTVLTPTGEAPDIDEARTKLELEISSARRSLRSDVAEARSQQLIDEFAAAAGPVEALETRSYDGPAVTAFDGEMWESRLQRAVADLPADLSEEEFLAIDVATKAAQQAILLQSAPTKVRSLVDAVNDLVHSFRRLTELRSEVSAAAAELTEQLFSLPGDLESHALSVQIGKAVDPISLERLQARVTVDLSRRRDLHAAEDRQRVLQVASDTLARAGYDLGEGFATANEPDTLAPTRSPVHALRVRERDGELYFNLVRVDPAGKTAPDQDARAEADWCSDFTRVRSELEDAGIELRLRTEMAPGERLVDVMTPDAVAENFGGTAAAAFGLDDKAIGHDAAVRKKTL